MIDEMLVTAGVVNDEFTDLTMDATVNITQSVTGQTPAGKSKAGMENPSDPAQQLHCAITVKGRTGVVLEILGAPSEHFGHQFAALSCVPPQFCASVETICSDHPAVLLSQWDRLKKLFPSLKCITEDPAHGKIRLMEPTGEKPNQISALVHSINMQSLHVDCALGRHCWNWGLSLGPE